MFGRKKDELDAERAAALEAKRSAEAELAEQKKLWPVVRREGAWHRLRRDQNHFAEDLRKLMEGGRPA